MENWGEGKITSPLAWVQATRLKYSFCMIFLSLGWASVQVVVTALAGASIGRRLLSGRFSSMHPSLGWATEAAAGLLLCSHLIFSLSLLRLTTRTNLQILFLLLGVLAALEAQRLPWSKIFSVWSIPFALYFGWLALVACLPPLAVDELVYHLAIPEEMLQAGGQVRFLDNIYAYFPQLGEMFFLFGLAVGGEVAARLFHALFGCLLALAIYGFSRKHLSRRAALGAVALFLSVPSVMVIGSWAYVDLIFSLYTFLALLALLEWFATRRLEWIVLGGVMSGGAMATKYTGLQVLLLLLLLILSEHLMARRKGLPRAAALLPVVAFPIVLPYLWRNWQMTGWPFFPFELPLFQLRAGINWDSHRTSLFLVWLSKFGARSGELSVWDMLVAPILVFLKARFDQIRWYRGVVGPIFLLAPFLLIRSWKSPLVRLLAVFSLLFLFYWAWNTRQVRFLIPVLPVLSFLVIFGLVELRSRIACALVAALVIVNLGTGVREIWKLKPMRFWSGQESREEYLRNRLIGYPIYQAANRHLGPEERLYLINMRNFGYYLNRPWKADFIFEFHQLEKFLSSASSADDLIGFFCSRGITHLMIDEKITEFGLLPEQQQKLRAFLQEHATLLERHGGQALYDLMGKGR